MVAVTLPNTLAASSAPAAEVPSYYVFYSRIPNSTVIFPDGTAAGFVNGRYTTKEPGKAAVLQDAIDAGHQYIYIDAEKPMLTEAELDPMAEYNARIIAEYLASQANLKSNDMGTSEQGRLNVADTGSVGALAADSSSGATATTPAASIKVGK